MLSDCTGKWNEADTSTQCGNEACPQVTESGLASFPDLYLECENEARSKCMLTHSQNPEWEQSDQTFAVYSSFQFLNKSSSVDTPLNTLNVLQAKQKASQTPYLLLSGGAQSMLA